MNKKDITETTSSGSVASVAMPLGAPQKRAGSLFKGKKTKKKFYEGKMKDLAYDILYMDAGNFVKKYGRPKESFTKNPEKIPHAPVATKKKPPVSEAELSEQDLILTPGQIKKRDRSFIPHDKDRRDHEVEMARSDMYAAAKDAMRIYKLIQNRSEDEGLMGWQQSYITLAADYLNSVADSLEHHAATEGAGVLAGGGSNFEEGIAEGLESFGAVKFRPKTMFQRKVEYYMTKNNIPDMKDKEFHRDPDLKPMGYNWAYYKKNGRVYLELAHHYYGKSSGNNFVEPKNSKKYSYFLVNKDYSLTPLHNVSEGFQNVDVAEGRFEFDKKTGQMTLRRSEPDERWGLFRDGKLIKAFWGKDADENVKRHTPNYSDTEVKKIDEVKNRESIKEEFKNTYNVGDKVNTPMGNGTIVLVPKTVNVDGKVKVKLDDPSRAGEDGKHKDTFVFTTSMLKHVSESKVVEGDRKLGTVWQLKNGFWAAKSRGNKIRKFLNKADAEKHAASDMTRDNEPRAEKRGVGVPAKIQHILDDMLLLRNQAKTANDRGKFTELENIKNKLEELENTVLASPNGQEIMDYFFTNLGKQNISEKKDACYNKVKSRYKVWPSAYASGALVKCRKVGASNWGNKSKKVKEDTDDSIDHRSDPRKAFWGKDADENVKRHTPNYSDTEVKKINETTKRKIFREEFKNTYTYGARGRNLARSGFGLEWLLDEWLLLYTKRNTALYMSQPEKAESLFQKMQEIEEKILAKKNGKEELEKMKMYVRKKV